MTDSNPKTLSDLLQQIADHSVHAIPPVWQEPVTVMTRWRLVQVLWPQGLRSRHLVGWADDEGRVCSAIVKLDVVALTAVTQSGRQYVLEGPSGFNADADWVFVRWYRYAGCVAKRDVSRALVKLHERGS